MLPVGQHAVLHDACGASCGREGAARESVSSGHAVFRRMHRNALHGFQACSQVRCCIRIVHCVLLADVPASQDANGNKQRCDALGTPGMHASGATCCTASSSAASCDCLVALSAATLCTARPLVGRLSVRPAGEPGAAGPVGHLLMLELGVATQRAPSTGLSACKAAEVPRREC